MKIILYGPRETHYIVSKSIPFVFLSTDVFLMEVSYILTGIKWWRAFDATFSNERSQMAQTKSVWESAERQRTQIWGMGAESKKEIINVFPYVVSFNLIAVPSSEFKRFENGWDRTPCWRAALLTN